MSFNATLAAAAAAANAGEAGNDAGAAAGQTSTPPPPAAPAGDFRSITAEEHQQLLAARSELAALRSQQSAEADRKERARLDSMAAEGRHKEALDQMRTTWETKHADAVRQFEELQAQVLGDKLTATISGAFAGRDFIGSTAEEKALAQADLTRLLEADFEAVRDAQGRVRVQDKRTGVEASVALKERLDGRRYALYFASKGAGANSKPAGGQLPAPTIQEGGSFLEQNAREFQSRQVQGFGFHKIG
ncbi:hypothetical protein [Paludisphaera rhizosphaerae]|uniref:hypothetical protein n=1 Tax=Paludisphaera rhizosphaerae TaxID=2711216 RepID=UPI0013EA8F0D|nr:hypothetical protein [Paludisphaera rhizosphaerae]